MRVKKKPPLNIQNVLDQFDDRDIFIMLFRQKDWNDRFILPSDKISESLGVHKGRLTQIHKSAILKFKLYADDNL